MISLRKFGIICLLAAGFFSCTEREKPTVKEYVRLDYSADILKGDSLVFESLKLKGAACISCLQQANNAYVSCLAQTKSESEKKFCLKALSEAIAGCSCPEAEIPADAKKTAGKQNGKSQKDSAMTGKGNGLKQNKTTVRLKTPVMKSAKSRNGIYPPGTEELAAIQTRYKDITLDKLTEGHVIYTKGACIKCHGAQNIYKRAEREWKEIIELMAVKAKISDSEKDAVYKYILAIKAAQPNKIN